MTNVNRIFLYYLADIILWSSPSVLNFSYIESTSTISNINKNYKESAWNKWFKKNLKLWINVKH